jgi:drug/metabolite transporter (DMT)-like permease
MSAVLDSFVAHSLLSAGSNVPACKAWPLSKALKDRYQGVRSPGVGQAAKTHRTVMSRLSHKIGFFEALLPTFLLAIGESYVTSAMASVLFSTMPVFTVIIGFVWLSRPLTRTKIVGVVTGFAGTLIVLIPDLSLNMGQGLVLLGVLAVLMASLAKAFAALYSHQVLENKEPVVVAATMMSAAALAGLPFMLMFENPFQIRPTGESLLALALIGVSSAAGFLIFFWLIKHRGPTFASLVRFNEPPIAILLSVLLLGDSLDLTTLIGMVVILLCIAIMNGYFDRFLARILPRRAAVSEG